MKLAGSSRKDGITFLGPHYQVKLTEVDGAFTVETKERITDSEHPLGKIPVIRGLYSLFSSSPLMLAGLALEIGTEAVLVRSGNKKQIALLNLMDIGLTSFLLWKLMGDIGAVRRYHGAEHKGIAAAEQGTETVDYAAVKKASRISSRCGTNFVGYYAASSLLVQLLPGKLETAKQILAMGIAYEGFRLDRKKYHAITAPLDRIGSFLQKYVTTAEPGCREIDGAVLAINTLLKKEFEYSS